MKTNAERRTDTDGASGDDPLAVEAHILAGGVACASNWRRTPRVSRSTRHRHDGPLRCGRRH